MYLTGLLHRQEKINMGLVDETMLLQLLREAKENGQTTLLKSALAVIKELIGVEADTPTASDSRAGDST